MTTTQNIQLWVGLALVVIVGGFLMVVFFRSKDFTASQHQLIHFFCALCAGFSGALITGSALIQADLTLGETGKVAVSGATGFALFILIWITFPKFKQRLEEGVHIKIGRKVKFADAAKIVAHASGRVVDFEGLTEAELSAQIPSQEVSGRTHAQVLLNLRVLAEPPIRKYEVENGDGLYILRIR